MTTSRSFILTAALACISGCAIDAGPDDLEDPEESVPAHPESSLPDDDDKEGSTDESSVEPGCTPQPTHWCETFQVSASYPNPGPYGTEIGYIGCINRADADLLTACQQNGGIGVGCCGGNQPNVNNHDHPWAEWSNGTWHCTGQMNLRRLCYPSSTNPECQPTCI
jgi:hypothetical protein